MIAKLFPPEVVSVVRSTEGELPPLHPEEAAAVGRASAVRCREFATGRACARQALARFGVHDFPLRRDAQRLPLWPPGIVGSISHSGGRCAVAVARTDVVLGIGLDLERIDRMKPAVLDRICTAAERAWLEEQGGGEQASEDDIDWATLLFSAKECTYKCYFPLARTRLGFRDVEIEMQPACTSFRARLVAEDAPSAGGVRSFEGRLGWSAQHVFTGIALRAPGTGAT